MWHDVKILPLMSSALKIESPEAKWSLWSGSISINFQMHKGAAYSRTSALVLQSSWWRDPSCSRPISLRPAKRASKEKKHLADPKRPLWSLSINIPNAETKLGSKQGWTVKKSCSHRAVLPYSTLPEEVGKGLPFYFSLLCINESKLTLNWLRHLLMLLFLFRAVWIWFWAPWSSLNRIHHDFAGSLFLKQQSHSKLISSQNASCKENTQYLLMFTQWNAKLWS